MPENWNSVSGAHPLPAGIERLLACRETRETSQKYTSYEEGASRPHQVANRRITGGSAARLVPEVAPWSNGSALLSDNFIHMKSTGITMRL